jgi:hypothetical protein
VSIGVGSNPISDSATVVEADEADFLNKRWYVNLHTTPDFGGGEIRGQVIVTPDPVPCAGILALGALSGLLFVRRHR